MITKFRAGDYVRVARMPKANSGAMTMAERKAIVGHVGVIAEGWDDLIEDGQCIVMFPHQRIEGYSAMASIDASALRFICHPLQPIHPDTFPPVNEAPDWYVP